MYGTLREKSSARSLNSFQINTGTYQQGFGSGSAFGELKDPDPTFEYGSGSMRTTKALI